MLSSSSSSSSLRSIHMLNVRATHSNSSLCKSVTAGTPSAKMESNWLGLQETKGQMWAATQTHSLHDSKHSWVYVCVVYYLFDSLLCICMFTNFARCSMWHTCVAFRGWILNLDTAPCWSSSSLLCCSCSHKVMTSAMQALEDTRGLTLLLMDYLQTWMKG